MISRGVKHFLAKRWASSWLSCSVQGLVAGSLGTARDVPVEHYEQLALASVLAPLSDLRGMKLHEAEQLEELSKDLKVCYLI